jgi:Flp pilus assembly protein TadG
LDQRKCKKNERGQVFALVAVIIPMLIIFVGLAIDLGLAYVTKTTLSKSVDAAALAAMRNLGQGETAATADAKSAFAANFKSIPTIGSVPTPNVNWFTGSPCTTGNTCVTISATATIPTFFLRALAVLPGVGSSYNTTSITISATAQRNPLVMSLMLDRSGSMQSNGGSAVLAGDVTDFINYFDQGTDNIAEISFAGAQSDDVNITTDFITPISNAVEGFTYRGGTYAYGAMKDGETQILSIPPNPNAIKIAVFFTDGWANTVQDSLNCTGTSSKPVYTTWNYGGCAYDSGVVDECNTVFFMNPTTGDWTNGKPAFGGSNNTCSNVTPPGTPGTFPAQKPGLDNTTNAQNITLDATYRTETLANTMRTTDNITIYSIGLGSLINQTYLQNLANDSGVVSKSQNEGEAVFAPTAAQLDTMFETIASKILLRLSQ